MREKTLFNKHHMVEHLNLLHSVVEYVGNSDLLLDMKNQLQAWYIYLKSNSNHKDFCILTVRGIYSNTSIIWVYNFYNYSELYLIFYKGSSSTQCYFIIIELKFQVINQGSTCARYGIFPLMLQMILTCPYNIHRKI